MSRSFHLPIAASIAGHGCVVALLILMVGHLPPIALPVPIATGGIAIMLAPPEPPPPVVEAPKPPAEPPPIPEAEPPPPEPPPPVVEAAPPPPKPAVKPSPRRPPPVPTPAPLQTALVPPPAPTPPAGSIVSAGYRAALSSWLDSHRHYPESARERGEEGRAVLRFRVDRSGRVVNYAIVQSTGHPDLDAAIDQMMRGASLPPFPAEMAASDVELSVAIRFALAR